MMNLRRDSTSLFLKKLEEVKKRMSNKISVEQMELQEERLDTSQAKRPFTEPKLTFVEPKLTEYGDATKITANGSFGHFS